MEYQVNLLERKFFEFFTLQKILGLRHVIGEKGMCRHRPNLPAVSRPPRRQFSYGHSPMGICTDDESFFKFWELNINL